jgi:hypothetical protein
MMNHVAASRKHVECGQVVEDEQDITGEEDQVVKEINQEVSYAVFEHSVFETGVGRGESGWCLAVNYCMDRHENCWSAVS